jgi:hypothetical protein
VARSRRVSLSQPSAANLPELVELARASRRLHRPWVYLPLTRPAWRRYLRRVQQGPSSATWSDDAILASLWEWST